MSDLQSELLALIGRDYRHLRARDWRAVMKPEDLRQAMRHWVTGVAVVAAAQGDVRHGMTVNTFTSVSLEPPLVLVALHRQSRTRSLVLRAGAFAVTVLSQHQAVISDRFAGQEEDSGERFAGLDTFTLVTGAPLLSDGEAWFDCRLYQALEAGTHTLILGEVVAVRAAEVFRPLVYANRAYRRLHHEPLEP